jgi:heme-degrading monooxygenase HmoA
VKGFELLRPTDGTNRYFVMTRWRDEEPFTAWVCSLMTAYWRRT